MKFYIDDDSADPALARLLRGAGHDARLPKDIGMAGKDDVLHLIRAISEGRVIVTRNYEDFKNLHELIMKVAGHYPGMLPLSRHAPCSLGPEASHEAIPNRTCHQQASHRRRPHHRSMHRPQPLAVIPLWRRPNTRHKKYTGIPASTRISPGHVKTGLTISRSIMMAAQRSTYSAGMTG